VVVSNLRVGGLWLPWFVRRSDPTVPVTDIGNELADAQQVRVRYLSDVRIWNALSRADSANPGAPVHTARIEALEARLRGQNVMLVIPAWPVPEDTGTGFVLMDGCHRACALYRLNQEAVVDVVVPPALSGAALHPMPRSTELKVSEASPTEHAGG
jgi:hypothetical protein